MSRQLHTLKEQYISNPTLTSLIEYLEQCKKENLWEDIIDIVSNWSGSETPEVHFYNGLALINLGEKNAGAKELRKVIQINPNHFAAKKELENIGAVEPENSAENKQPFEALKNILIIEPKLEEENRYRANLIKNTFLGFIVLTVIIFLAYFLLKKDKADKYEDLLSDPQLNFTSMNYNEYLNTVRDYKITDIKEEIGDPIKKCILWRTALAVVDYRLDFENEDISQLKMYSTLITEKGKELNAIIDYIYGNSAPVGIQLYHKLDIDYPESLNQIKVLKIEIPSEIKKENLRGSFYKALMLFRRSDLSEASELVKKILAVFPDYELAQKLNIMIKAQSAIKGNVVLDDIAADIAVLDKWKTLSVERYFFGEAKILIGIASKKEDIQTDGFYSVCPGRKFCKDIVKSFIKSGNSREASRMALYMKEQKENNRDADDIKLIIETSYLEGDYSNCYFSFRELAQFFPDSVDDESLMKGSECSEKNGYFEEAVAGFEKINEKDPKIETTARILKMKYKLSGEELYFNQLKELVEKNGDNILLLYSYLETLSRKNNIFETVEILEKIYSLETPDKKGEIIGEYLKLGAIAQAIKHLEELKGEKKYRKMLIDIYNRYMLFEKADALLAKDEIRDPMWVFLREQLALKDKGEFEIASKNINERMEFYDKCEPSFLYLKAELFRNQGDKQRTFGMIDSILECAPHYLPGLVIAAEITYYQGDLTKARDGISYILENEKYLSPGAPYYHNYLVLLNVEIMVAVGKESSIMAYLQKNLIKGFVFGPKEQEKIDDISEKLKESKQQILRNYLRRNFKFSAPQKGV